jgi:shikimate 5-dehydrogenase
MFIEQAAMSFQLWTGVDPDRQVLREAVEEFLEL